jgi:hypothetical protein
MGKFMSSLDLHEARREFEIFNSRVKRGEIDPDEYVREQYVVCGCGVEGCGFITRWLKEHPGTIDLKAEHERYNKWLEENQK